MSGRPDSRLRAVAGLTIAALGVALLLVATHQLVARDLWWQLAAGAWIVEHGLPRVDPWSFGHPGRPWIEQRWLFFVAEHAITQRAGLNGLIGAKLVWLAACFGLLERAMRPAPRWARAIGLAVAVALLHSRLKVRPELVTYLTVIAFLLVFDRHRRSGRNGWLLALPLLQLVWSNGHTLWIAGPAMAWIAWALEAGLARWPRLADPLRLLPALAMPQRRALLYAAVAVSIASLVTPYLFLGQLYPTTILEQIGVGSKLREVIVELRSPFSLRHDPIFFGSYAGGLLLSFACMLLPVRAPALRVALWAGFVGFSFLAARNVSLLGPVAGWVVAHQLGDWAQAGGAERAVAARRVARSATALALVGALVLSAGALTDRLWRGRGWEQRFGTGVREALYPIEAMAFVEQHDLPRPVLSSLSDASYLIHEGGPRSVFIDGRLEVYGADRVLENARQWSTAEGVMADADRHGVDSVLLLFPLMTEAIRGFEASPDWAPVYYDAARVLYLRRTPATHAQRAALEIDWTGARRGRVPAHPRPRAGVAAALSPPDWADGWAPRVVDSGEPFGRAMLLLLVGATGAGEQALREVVAKQPEHVEARLNLGLLAELRGDEAVAREHFSHVAAARRQAIDVHEARVALARRYSGDGRSFRAAVAALGAGSRAPIVIATVVEQGAAPGRIEAARRALREALAASRASDADDSEALRAALRAIERPGPGR